jgi:membrane fusion protein, multidrug efflux system
MRHISFLLLFAPVLAIQVACSDKQTDVSTTNGKPVQAAFIEARYETVQAFATAPGTVQARNRIVISSQINGFVREMRVRAGDGVQPNQVLATLDGRDAESQKAAALAAIDEAQAALSEARRSYQAAAQTQAASKASADLAKQTLSRYQKLFESRSVSPQEMDEVRMRRDASAAELASRESMVAAAQERIKQAEARIAQAQAQAGRADVLMGYTEIKAPAEGRIAERSADAGTAIFPGTLLFVIESIAKPQVLADIQTEYAGHLRVGMNVRLGKTASEENMEGRIAEIIPGSNPATHSVQFKVDLPQSNEAPTGQFIQISVPVGTRNALLIPVRAIRTTGQLTGLFVLDQDARVHYKLVKAAPYDSDRMEILSGVEPGEKVLAALNDRITDGTTVEIRHE